MAVAVDTFSPEVTFAGIHPGGTSAPITVTHPTIDAAVSLILLFIEKGSTSVDTDVAWGTLTLGGKAFTPLAGSVKHSGDDGQTVGLTEIYYMTAASIGEALPTGDQTVSATFTAAFAAIYARLRSVSFTGSDLASPLGTPQVDNGQFVTSLSASDDLAAGDLLVGIAANGSDAPTSADTIVAAAGSTNSAADNYNVAQSAGTGTTTLTYGTNGGDWSAMSAVKIVAALAAATAVFARDTGAWVPATAVFARDTGAWVPATVKGRDTTWA